MLIWYVSILAPVWCGKNIYCQTFVYVRQTVHECHIMLYDFIVVSLMKKYHFYDVGELRPRRRKVREWEGGLDHTTYPIENVYILDIGNMKIYSTYTSIYIYVNCCNEST